MWMQYIASEIDNFLNRSVYLSICQVVSVLPYANILTKIESSILRERMWNLYNSLLLYFLLSLTMMLYIHSSTLDCLFELFEDKDKYLLLKVRFFLFLFAWKIGQLHYQIHSRYEVSPIINRRPVGKIIQQSYNYRVFHSIWTEVYLNYKCDQITCPVLFEGSYRP